MRGIIKYIALVPLILLSSCYSASKFDMEGLEPAEITISPSIKTLTLVSRTDLDSAYKAGFLQKGARQVFEQDSTFAKEAVVGCVDGLLDGPRFQVYDPVIRRTLSGDYTDSGRLLPWPLIRKIAGNPPVDGVLALESYAIRDTMVLRNEEGWSYIEQITKVRTYWRLYQLEQLATYDFTFNQTYTWDRGSDPDQIKSSAIQKDIYRESMYKAGQEAARKLAPYWTELERVYFPYGNEDFIRAAKFLRDGNWREAASLWGNYVNAKSSVTAAKARFNMAVASEMGGNLDMATEWLKRSSEKGMDPYFTGLYEKELKKSAARKANLDKQMVSR